MEKRYEYFYYSGSHLVWVSLIIFRFSIFFTWNQLSVLLLRMSS